MYYLVLALLYPLSLLPLNVLYLFSDFAYGLLYYVIGYRKQIVYDNLRQAFPEKTEEEILKIRKEFYKSFCDQWIETLKLLSISQKELNKRMQSNWEVLHQLNEEGRNAYVMLGHNFNWEWGNVAMQANAEQQFAGLYLPLESKVFDRLMQRIRTRNGGIMISMKAIKGGLQKIQNQRHIVGLIADQNPSVTEVAMWLPFMHREAPFFRGPEQMARRSKGAVVFAGISKLKRGYYYMDMKVIFPDASVTSQGEITRTYVQLLEQQLHKQPPNWLWSHRRWKHVRKS
jgi:Kdo2-lipid IVA lauroyltransferase/acyltransferase